MLLINFIKQDDSPFGNILINLRIFSFNILIMLLKNGVCAKFPTKGQTTHLKSHWNPCVEEILCRRQKKRQRNSWRNCQKKTILQESFNDILTPSKPASKNDIHYIETSFIAEAKINVLMRRTEALEIKGPFFF